MAGPVFISYSRIDRLYVERLARHLSGAGIPVWYDIKITAGERFAKEVSDRIRACSALVVVLSPSSCASEWVERELHYAVERSKVILPVLLAPCEAPIHVSGLHYENVAGGRMPSEQLMALLRSAATDQANQKAANPKKKPARPSPPTDVDRITTAITDALRTRNPLPLSTAAHLIQEIAPRLAQDWGGSGKCAMFVRDQLPAFGFVPDNGGYLWLASSPKPRIPAAAPPKNKATAPPKSQPVAPEMSPSAPTATKMLPVVTKPKRPRPLGPPTRSELSRIRKALREALVEHQPLRLGVAAETVRKVTPEVAMTWGGTEKFTTFIDQFLPEFAYTERKGGHLWLAPPSRTAAMVNWLKDLIIDH